MAAGLIAAVLAGTVPSTTRSGPLPPPEQPPLLTTIPPAVASAIETAEASGDEFIEMELRAGSPGDLAEIRQAVAAAGGEVLAVETLEVRARLPVASASSLPVSTPVTAVGVNRQVQIEEPQVATQNQAITAGSASAMTAASMDPLGVGEFWSRLSVNGRGVVVAVIDSGIDPVHAGLARTPDGQRKLIDYKDFTDEGMVETTEQVPWGAAYVASSGRSYRLPPKPAASQEARFGFWEEYRIAGTFLNRDLDQNGTQADRFGVLLVDAARTGVYDTVYVDTNNNGDFNDEVALKLFAIDGSTARMGRFREGELGARRLAFAVADIDAKGAWVSLGFDGLGHGTQVAGVIGGYTAGGFTGVAPGAQLMAIKAMRSTGFGDWFAIKQAIRYAAENGAQIINVSIGGLAAAAARSDSTASEWMNEIARKHGVLIVLAADNSGPGLSSGTSLGSPSEVLVIGAYYSPAMWQRDFGFVVPFEGVWSLSGMGPRSDGSYVPNVVAPGGSPTLSPIWRHSTGYTTAVGTSIATAHASGAAALLTEAGKRRGVNHDRLSVKRAMEMGARQLHGFGVFEQGHGLIQLTHAFTHQERINSIPAVRARTTDGNGGLLARSYKPGSVAFELTNLGDELKRVNISSSQNWVRAALTTMTLPPGVTRQLPLDIAPPDTAGVNSAFLSIVNPAKYGPSVTLPITHVQAIDLSTRPEQRHTVSDQLEAARYKRYFFEVKPGSGSFSVSFRMQMDNAGRALGTAQVQVFRPDGQAAHRAELGTRGTGLATLFQLDQPVAGVWEVVVTAMPDSTGSQLSAAYTVEARTQRGISSAFPIQLTVPAGSTTTHQLRFTNTFAPFTGQIQTVGLVRLQEGTSWAAGVPWRVEKRTQSIVEDFTLREATSYMRVETDNVIPADVDLDLYLYHLGSSGWRLMGQSVQKGTSREAIELTNLPSGRYQVHAYISGNVPAGVQHHYRRLMAVEGFHAFTDDPERRRERNEAWSPTLTLRAPSTPGRYLGQILLRDTENKRVLAWMPFEVSVGQPALGVEPLVTQLVQGQRGNVVLEIRDGATGKLADAPVLVNGQRYISRGGQVRIPVLPSGSELVLDVEVNAAAYQFFRRRITIPVRQQWGDHPLGIDSHEENSIWRRKVQSQLSQ